MSLIQLLGTGLTVWKIAAKQVGPVGGLLAAVTVVAGLVYLESWLAENVPALAGTDGST